MLSARLLPCTRCGAWGSQAGLCSGCGAADGAPEQTLEHWGGDGRWVHVLRGSAAQVRRGLVAIEPPSGAAEDAALRCAAAAALLDRLGSDELTVCIDLRRGEAGPTTRALRGGSRQETFYTLPWLVARAPGAELRVVRRLHLRQQRTFGRDRVNTTHSRFFLDELWLRTTAGVLRQPCADPARLAHIDPSGCGPHVPGWDRSLPPSLPGVSSSRSLPVGVAAALALLVLLPALARTLARPDPGRPSDALDLPRLSPTGARSLLGASDRWSQRKGLAAASALPHPERLRLLRSSVLDPRRDLDARLLAVDLLSREGSLGVTTLLLLERELARGEARRPPGSSPAPTIELRRAILRALAAAGPDPRVAVLAQERLQSSHEAASLRCSALTALATVQEPPTPQLLLALERTLDEADPLLRSQAGAVLARLSPTAAPTLRLALRRSLADRPAHPWPTVQRLARALVAAGDDAGLREELARADLLPADARALLSFAHGR